MTERNEGFTPPSWPSSISHRTRNQPLASGRLWPIQDKQWYQSTQVHLTGADQADQADDDQIDCDDVVEHPGYDKDQDAGEQGDDRGQAEVEVHEFS